MFKMTSKLEKQKNEKIENLAAGIEALMKNRDRVDRAILRLNCKALRAKYINKWPSVLVYAFNDEEWLIHKEPEEDNYENQSWHRLSHCTTSHNFVGRLLADGYVFVEELKENDFLLKAFIKQEEFKLVKIKEKE